LVAGGLSACQHNPLPNSDVDYCTIVPDPPVKDGSHIAAPVHYTCDGKGASSLTITITLEKQTSGGSWTRLVTDTFVAKGKNTSRGVSLGNRTKKVLGACTSGTFRTSMHTVEHSKGHSQTFSQHSVSVPKPCNEAF
ncbi:MAG TPA: hypothetical protein VGJ28_02075, partial [Micromonosporaceae bacterium]